MEGENHISTIANMLEAAKEHGLEVEVVYSFALELECGITDWWLASTNALSEWDI